MTTLQDLIGKTIVRIIKEKDRCLVFITSDGEGVGIHNPDVECVFTRLETVIGNLQDIIGSPILAVEESQEDLETLDTNELWTYYKLITENGSVKLDWCSESYYEEYWDGESEYYTYNNVPVNIFTLDKNGVEARLNQLKDGVKTFE